MADKPNNTTKQFEKAARNRYICNLYFGEKKTAREIAVIVGKTIRQVNTILSDRKEEWKDQQDEAALSQVMREDVAILDATIATAVANYTTDSNPRTGKLITELIAQKAKMLGLLAPVKSANTTPDGGSEAAIPVLQVTFGGIDPKDIKSKTSEKDE